MFLTAYLTTGGSMLESMTIPAMLLFSLALQFALFVVLCILAVVAGRVFVGFATKVGLAASVGRFGAAVSEAYREQKQ